MLKSAAAIVLALCIPSCDQECLSYAACAIPLAIEALVLSASTGKPVSGAFVAVSEPVTTTVSCDSSCVIPGFAGTYRLTATAPGYQSLQRTVVVQGSSQRCGCASAQTAQVHFVMEPSP